MKPASLVASLLALGILAGCRETSPQALGTLEYDRITLPAPVSERIVAIEVREGERVRAGQVIVRLEATRTRATTEALQAQAMRERAALVELEAGARTERIAQARAQLAAANAQAREARAYHARVQPLGRQRLVAAAEVDRARAAAASADAQARSAQAMLDELAHGARTEQLAQAEAAVRSAAAQAAAQRVSLERLRVTAPRAGVIDSLPFESGDEPPPGAPLAILLVGDVPYARIYVPAPIRASVAVGTRALVHFEGGAGRAPVAGTVRTIRSEPGFTPYYALTGDDASRLSWLAEIELDAAAAGLPAGLPVRVEFHD